MSFGSRISFFARAITASIKTSVKAHRQLLFGQQAVPTDKSVAFWMGGATLLVGTTAYLMNQKEDAPKTEREKMLEFFKKHGNCPPCIERMLKNQAQKEKEGRDEIVTRFRLTDD